VTKDALLLGLSGIFFGLLVGWIIGSQTAAPVPSRAPEAAAVDGAAPAGAPARAPALDEAKVRELTAAAERAPRDASIRRRLGDLYFEAERFDEAIRWYEEAVRLDPRDVEASTALGVSYYYTNQPDRALEQFDRSLAIDPSHARTMLNVGIVRAFGKQDLRGAVAAWERVVAVAPDSPEGRAARQALETLRAAHPGVAGPQGAAPRQGGATSGPPGEAR
jgi:tetratricopeptide (TPR) repeat protein